MEKWLLLEDTTVISQTVAGSKDQARQHFDNAGWQDAGEVISEKEYMEDLLNENRLNALENNMYL